jgi:acid phosphatase family membrane protein YuiD
MATPKQFQSYDQLNNDLQQAIIHANLSAQKEEIALKEKPLFSKKELEEIRGKIPYYFMLGIVAGFIFAWVVCKII